MKSKFKNCFRDSPRSGLTLIEVVVGLLLLSTLLVGVLMGFRRHARQIQRAQQRLEAIERADSMLAEWFATPEGLPVAASGQVPGSENLTWETQLIDARPADPMGVHIVRLEIRRRDLAAEPLVTVDLVVPAAGETTKPRGER